MKKISGVYQIKNLRNGKIYIGASQDADGRRRAHLGGRGNLNIKIDLLKFSRSDFEFSILIHCNGKNLFIKEIELIEKFRPEYNLAIAENGQIYHAETSKIKMSLAGKGRPKTAEHRHKIGLANSRRVYTYEMRRNRSGNRKGKPITSEHLEAIKRSLIGIPKTKEHRKKIGDAIRAFHERKRHENGR